MKNLLLFVSAIGLTIIISSCTKNSVSIAPTTKNSKSTTTPIIINTNLQGSWTIITDSTFWAGELPKKLVSAYKGKAGDSFNFSSDGHLYIKEDALSDTTTYSIDSAYNINVTYTDAKHFNEAPGFGLELDPVGYDPTIPVYFRQNSISANTLILICGMGTPDGVATRYIYMKKDN